MSNSKDMSSQCDASLATVKCHFTVSVQLIRNLTTTVLQLARSYTAVLLSLSMCMRMRRVAASMSELRVKKESELRERTAAFTLFTSNLTRALSLGTKVLALSTVQVLLDIYCMYCNMSALLVAIC
jgi:hypothetical protein